AFLENQPLDGKPSTEEKVLKVKSRTDFYKVLAQEMGSAQRSIKGLTRLDMHHHVLHDALQKASDRNVTIQLAGEHPESFIEKMSGMENVELKHAQHGLHAYVIDDQKVIMLLSDMRFERPEYHFTIWPENTALAQALTQTFDSHWGE
ncbi:MAG: hypothetical protein AABY11_03805, partial [archaeon]